jgi:uncharacterized protein (DUF58 family)
MVTRRGWLLVGSAFALVVCGRILGIAELFGLAVAAVAVVVASRVYVSRGVGEVAVTARISPPVAHMGEAARLELRVQNRGRRVSRAVLLRPAPYRGARTPIEVGEIAVPPLVPGEDGRIVLTLPTTARGAFELSGFSLDLEDPLGVACRRVTAPCSTRLVVLPVLEQLEDLAPFSAFAGRHEALRSAASRLGSGLSSFRSYAEGDDLRLVHWKTTARIGELMVREGGDPEAPESLSITVVLDTRRSPHTAATFETAVSAAASVLDPCAELGASLRLVTTGGVDTGFGGDDDHLESALVELAIAETRSDSMTRNLRIDDDRDTGSGVLVAITSTRAVERDLDILLEARRARRRVLVLVSDGGPPAVADPPATHVVIDAGTSVRAAWLDAFGAPDVETPSRDEPPSRLGALAPSGGRR